MRGIIYEFIISANTRFVGRCDFSFELPTKKRKNIIIWNVISRILYILQYLLLGAFSGAVLDVLGTLSSVLAEKKQISFIKKHLVAILVSVNALIIIAGLCIAYINKSLLDIFPTLINYCWLYSST